MSRKPIRVGVIGCGQFMSRQHIQTIGRSENLKLMFLADQDEVKLREIASLYHPEKTSTRWEDAVCDPDVDVVVAGILPKFHPAVARAALEHKKPVYIEKPLTENLAEGLELQRLSQKLGVSLAVGFNRRFAPAIRHIDPLLRAAKGPFTFFYRICDDDRVRPPEQEWKKQDRLLIEIVHIFDLLCYLTRSQPRTIYAVESRFNDALVTLEFSDNSHATILSSSWGSLAQPKEHLEAVVNRSVIEMDDFVEVRSFGNLESPAKACFAGRPYDRCNNQHVEAFRRDGLAALLEMRRNYHQSLERSGVLANSADAAAWEKARKLLGDPPLPQINYAPDKGWGVALEEFCTAAMDGAVGGESPQNAGAADGNRASACALAARKSIETGEPVLLRPKDWEI